MIHPSAVIHPAAEIGRNVTIGPFAVLDEHVRIGDNCLIGPHVYVTGATAIGSGTQIHAGAVIGDLPQDLKFKEGLTGVVIGSNNVIREHVTVHRSNNAEQPTTIGSNNLLMANSHIGHNSILGDHVVIANGALLGGHAEVGDRAFISGNCMVHQHTRVGALALMQGGSGISKDLPPYTIARGNNGVCGLNVVGLRRAGFNHEERLELRRLYQAVLRKGGRFSEKIGMLENEFSSAKARIFLDFLKTSKRGFCVDHKGETNLVD